MLHIVKNINFGVTGTFLYRYRLRVRSIEQVFYIPIKQGKIEILFPFPEIYRAISKIWSTVGYKMPLGIGNIERERK